MGLTIFRTSNCGVLELSGISTYKDPEEVVAVFARRASYTDFKVAFVTFTGVTVARDPLHNAVVRTDDYGQALQNYIEAKKLGEVVCTKSTFNPASGNDIRVWIWTPDFAALKDFNNALRNAEIARVAQLD